MPKFNGKTQFKKVALGSLLGAAVTLLTASAVTMFLALFIASGKIGEGAEKAVVVASAFAAAALGAQVARLKNHGAALLSGVLTALFAILLRLLAGLAGGDLNIMDGGDMGIFLSILCGGIASGAITVHSRRRRR